MPRETGAQPGGWSGVTRGKISRDKAREGMGVRPGGGDHGRGRTKRDTGVALGEGEGWTS